jgi:hypothetical protein
MATLPQFKQRQIARRSTSDIERLAQQYQSNVNAIAGEYQTAFTGYQADAAAKMKPFEEASLKYGKDLADYTANVAAPYKSALEAYQKNSEKYLTETGEIFSGARDKQAKLQQYTYKKGGQTIQGYRFTDPFTGSAIEYSEDLLKNPKKYGFSSVLTPMESGRRGTNIYTFRPLPTSEEPVTPEKPADFAGVQPEAPDIGEFDAGEFGTKRAAAESTFKREVGERRAAKLGAVSRKMTRPMLRGAE